MRPQQCNVEFVGLMLGLSDVARMIGFEKVVRGELTTDSGESGRWRIKWGKIEKKLKR